MYVKAIREIWDQVAAIDWVRRLVLKYSSNSSPHHSFLLFFFQSFYPYKPDAWYLIASFA
jgi:hypothetical protein